jgi:hypothetical protein
MSRPTSDRVWYGAAPYYRVSGTLGPVLYFVLVLGRFVVRLVFQSYGPTRRYGRSSVFPEGLGRCPGHHRSGSPPGSGFQAGRLGGAATYTTSRVVRGSN